MAHKLSAGSASNLKDSIGKRLGVKLSDGQAAKPGAIIIRQRGTKFHAGQNVKRGKDDTLFATAAGIVRFTTKKLKKYDNRLRPAKIVSVAARE